MEKLYFSDAIEDISESFKHWNLWSALAWQDIKARYRRSTLGPLWLTISMAVTLGAMGPLYSLLFRFNSIDFIPHLALGLIFWGFISGSISEFGDAFFSSSHFLKQVKIPLTVFVLRVCFRHLVILGHNIVIYPVIMLLLGLSLSWNIIWLIPGMIIVIMNIFWIGLLLAIFCTRYRDMLPVITSLMTLMFFITPIVWKVEQLPESRRYMADLNPFTAMLELLRQPMLGNIPATSYWLYTGIIGVSGILIAVLLLARCRHRVNYWL